MSRISAALTNLFTANFQKQVAQMMRMDQVARRSAFLRSMERRRYRPYGINPKGHFKHEQGIGPRECARRVRQMFSRRMGLLHVVAVEQGVNFNKGEGMLATQGRCISAILVQADDLQSVYSLGWHEVPAHQFALGY